MSSGFFVTGVSTEVGKTYVGSLIARALYRAGRRVGVYKPVASGCREEGGVTIAADAEALWEAAGRPLTLEQVCPQRFLAPLAPSRAAAEEGTRVDDEQLVAGLAPWRAACDVLLVEGAGGLMSPLSDAWYNVDLAARLGLPLLVVANNHLGVINATLQTLITARARAPELPVAGVILNDAAHRPDDLSLSSNAAEIAARADAPLLATIAFGQQQLEPERALSWLR